MNFKEHVSLLYRLFFLDRSITYKIALVALTPVTLATCCTILLGLASLQHSITQYFHLKTQEIVFLAAYSIEGQGYPLSNDQLHRSLDKLMEESDVTYAMILDENNRTIIAHSNKKEHGKDFDEKQYSLPQIYNASAPIMVDNAQVGLLIVGFATHLYIDFFHHYKLIQIVFGILLLVIVSLLIYYLARIINLTIEKMSFQAKEIGTGSFDCRIAYRGNDELGRFVQTFHTMSGHLEQTLEALQQERAGLKKQVAKQTAEIRESLEQLRFANLRLEEALQGRTRFFSSISHELRTPLNGILGTISLLQEKHFGQLNDKQMDYALQIEASGKHLLSLINDTLDMAKIDANSMALERNPFDLIECVDSTLKMLDSLFIEKKIHLLKKYGTPILIFGDYRRIRQVVFNLVANAIKFTDTGGQVIVSIEEKDTHVKLKVNDSGIGIGAENIPALFEPFHQVPGKHQHNQNGSGLGLALCKGIVKLHQGKIGVESLVDKGSTFWFTLPLGKEFQG